jgi:hypothetical protein
MDGEIIMINDRQNPFAPTPMHGAAYAVALETIGGINAVADCDTQQKYRAVRMLLDELEAWCLGESPEVVEAYQWGINKVDADLQGRLSVYVNSRAVAAALDTLPRPPRHP